MFQSGGIYLLRRQYSCIRFMPIVRDGEYLHKYCEYPFSILNECMKTQEYWRYNISSPGLETSQLWKFSTCAE